MQYIFNIQCHRQKLIKNVHLTMLITETEIIFQKNDKQKNPLIFEIDLTLKIDWKLKANQFQAIGIKSDKHHWYYADSSQLANIKKWLGGKVMYEGVSDIYKPLQQIGQGSFSNVYLLFNTYDQEYYAGKCLDKIMIEQGIGQVGLFQEIKAMTEFMHKNITQLYEVYEGDVSYYIIIDHLNVELVDYIKNDTLDIQEIRIIMKQMVEGLKEIHDLGYMHRDMKPENIMFKENIYNLKIIDFGLIAQTPSYSRCGTPGYIAPEILNLGELFDCYDEKVDIFSIGAVFYKLLTKQDLFKGKNHDEILLANTKCQIDLQIINADRRIPKTAIELLSNMLEINPEKRPTCFEILESEFIDQNQEIEQTDISKAKSPIFKQLSPLQRKQSTNKQLGSFFLQEEEENIGFEPHMQPIPKIKLTLRGPSLFKVYSANVMQGEKSTEYCETTNFKRPKKANEKSNFYRPPKPKQLQELYK